MGCQRYPDSADLLPIPVADQILCMLQNECLLSVIAGAGSKDNPRATRLDDYFAE